MSDPAETPAEPQAAPETPKIAEVEKPTPAAPQQQLTLEAPAPKADIKADPAVRAAIDQARAEATAEANRQAAAVAEKIRAEATTEVEERLRKEAAEAARVAEMNEREKLEHEIKKRDEAIKANEDAVKAAQAQADASAKQLDFVRALTSSGLRMPTREDKTVDPALERIAFEKVQAQVAGGLSLAEALADVAKTDPYLFARPTEPQAPTLTSTSAGQGAQRGAVSQGTSPAADPEKDWLVAPRDEFNHYIKTRGYLKDAEPARKRRVH